MSNFSSVEVCYKEGSCQFYDIMGLMSNFKPVEECYKDCPSQFKYGMVLMPNFSSVEVCYNDCSCLIVSPLLVLIAGIHCFSP